MSKRFAIGDSEGPRLENLQLEFWRLAVQRFKEIQQKLQEHGVEDREDSQEYNDDDFVIDAVVALVLAGTSVSQLLGQNVEANREGRIPSPENALAGIIRHCKPRNVPTDIARRFKSFVELYDALRHFGESKHDIVASINEETLCKHLATVRDTWKLLLQSMDDEVSSEFICDFRLE